MRSIIQRNRFQLKVLPYELLTTSITWGKRLDRRTAMILPKICHWVLLVPIGIIKSMKRYNISLHNNITPTNACTQIDIVQCALFKINIDMIALDSK